MLILFTILICYSSALEQKVTNVQIVGLFVASSELPIYQEAMEPVLQLAADEAMRRNPNLNISVKVRKGSNSCQANHIAAYAAEAYYQDGVSAFIGPACSMALDSVARMAAYWNVPLFTAGGISLEFANKRLYSSLTRLSFSVDRISHFVVKVLSEFDFHHISLIVDESDMAFSLVRKSLEKVFETDDLSTSASSSPLSSHVAYDIKLDVQAFATRSTNGDAVVNKTIDLKKLLISSSKSARGQFAHYS
ncbi:Receptor-type guanylate cyclase gcy-8 [Halotydeus destructor]|nr:Receptor-type guanylate cyclase gcy-8 [Halotydeus destructor]